MTNTLDLFRLDGKTAIITGGGRGLGQYFAEALSDAGANVVLCSRKLAACEEVQREIESRGGKALALACDVTQQSDVERVVEATQQHFSSIDILVNNSGATWGAPAEQMPLDKFDHVIDVNIKGTFIMSQLVGRTMIARGQGGKIVNIASVAGLVGGKSKYIQVAGYLAGFLHVCRAESLSITKKRCSQIFLSHVLVDLKISKGSLCFWLLLRRII